MVFSKEAFSAPSTGKKVRATQTDLQDGTHTGANPHLHQETRLKGERMRNLYIVRSELFRDQQIQF